MAENKKFFSRDEILKLQDRKTEEVFVPEWGCSVLVKEMSAADRDQLDALMVKREGDKIVGDVTNQRAKIVVMTAVNEKGERLFSADDVAALAEKNGKAINRIYEAAVMLGVLQADAIDEAAKN